jgi:hypothetical protein
LEQKEETGRIEKGCHRFGFHQKVGVQFSGSSKFKEYSKNYDNIEFMEENNLQYVKNIGSRKRPRYTTSDIQVKRASPKCKTCKPTRGHKKSGCK